jgi:ubiquinone/menaquinone biosynthesis C-methylase UbiE
MRVSSRSPADIRNPFFARLYAHVLEPLAARDGNRPRLLAGLHGKVVEIGCGAGVNFARYPLTVSKVIAVEPEPYLRERARQAAASAPVVVEVVGGQADGVPVEDESADAVVSSFVLCSVPDQASALAEMRRVLRPGGELRFYEHVAARNPLGLALQRAADATFWPRAFGNCHTTRDTQTAIEQAGFTVEQSSRLRFPDVEPPLPHILGVARRA